MTPINRIVRFYRRNKDEIQTFLWIIAFFASVALFGFGVVRAFRLAAWTL